MFTQYTDTMDQLAGQHGLSSSDFAPALEAAPGGKAARALEADDVSAAFPCPGVESSSFTRNCGPGLRTPAEMLRDDGCMEPQVGDTDGFGTFGVVDETADGLLCHDCGRRFTHLGLHAFKAHEVTAGEYRAAHGLGRRGLVVKATAQTLADNARRTMSSRPAFVEARDPVAASASQRRGSAAISPAGQAAIRESARARRGTRRLGTVVTCEWCGVQFCPLVAAAPLLQQDVLGPAQPASARDLIDAVSVVSRAGRDLLRLPLGGFAHALLGGCR